LNGVGSNVFGVLLTAEKKKRYEQAKNSFHTRSNFIG